jgi:hypothetical protein
MSRSSSTSRIVSVAARSPTIGPFTSNPFRPR